MHVGPGPGRLRELDRARRRLGDAGRRRRLLGRRAGLPHHVIDRELEGRGRQPVVVAREHEDVGDRLQRDLRSDERRDGNRRRRPFAIAHQAECRRVGREVHPVLVGVGVANADVEGHVGRDLDPELQLAIAVVGEVTDLAGLDAAAEPLPRRVVAPRDHIAAFIRQRVAGRGRRAIPQEDVGRAAGDQLVVDHRVVGEHAEFPGDFRHHLVAQLHLALAVEFIHPDVVDVHRGGQWRVHLRGRRRVGEVAPHRHVQQQIERRLQGRRVHRQWRVVHVVFTVVVDDGESHLAFGPVEAVFDETIRQ